MVDVILTACPNCQAALPEISQTTQQVYDRFELPPIKPDVTQVRLFGGRCACCGERVIAAAPAGLETGFAIRSVDRCLGGLPALYHAISMERQATLMEEIFWLTLREG